MKVGIMSMQRVCNYGSFLQAYALKKTIEAMGHNVEFVDYAPGKPVSYETNKKLYFKSLAREKIMNMAAQLSDVLFFANEDQRYSLGFKKRYKQEFLPILGIRNKKHYRSQVDVLIVGSDEVFNCLQMNPAVGFSPELFGKNNQAKRLITYAASFGNTTLQGLESAKKTSELRTLLSDFHALSVRDANSGSIVRSLTGREVVYHFDPVLIYDFSKEPLPAVYERDYIVVYAYRNRLSQPEIEAIKAFAAAEKKKIISIGGYQSFSDLSFSGTPFEVLSYIRGADYVITDTFHGTIFSIINHRKFATFIRSGHGCVYGNQEKLIDLLDRLGLTDRAVFSPEHLQNKIREPIDYTSVDQTIRQGRENAIHYLQRNLS